MSNKRTRLKKIQNQFDTYTTLDPRVAVQAAKTVSLHAKSKKDGVLLLDMLGLIEPQPEYRPITQKEYKAIERAERLRHFEEIERIVKKKKPPRNEGNKYDEALFKRHGVTPSEIGEE